MSKAYCIISSPVDTYSGYGARSRDFIKALIQARPEWNIKLLSQRWGNTRFGYLEDHNESDLESRIIGKIERQPDVWIQISVPNEFQKVGKYSIGVTAGIETTVCDMKWIQGVNRMDLILTSSNHSKEVFNQTIYTLKDKRTNQSQELRTTTPIEVLFEGVDEEKYTTKNFVNIDLNIPETFAFLVVGHWMKGDLGHDRKNIGYTVKMFLETFKNKSNPPALILKTHQVGTSILDREAVLDKINSIRKTIKGTLPNIYLLHGEMTDEEVNGLYNHPKVKAMVSFNKGEGFGRPLLEFTTTGKPVIASNWSGQLDFLHKEYSVLVGGRLEDVHSSAQVKEIILKEAKWFQPDDKLAADALKTAFKKYNQLIKVTRKHKKYTLDNFTLGRMTELLTEIVDKNVPEFAEQVELNLPQLKLPKLKKIQ